MHLAAFKSVPLSVAEPLAFYRNNVEGTHRLLESMVQVAYVVWCSHPVAVCTALRTSNA